MPDIQDYLFKYHKKGKHVVTYGVVKRETGTTSYFQYVNIDGYWYMMKEVRVDAVVTTTYSVPVHVDTTSLADGWTGRATLTYTTFDEAFS